MPHVLVLGATGTLGSALCTHLLNAGHTVFGLARSPSKASGLLQSEIIPVLGSVESPQGITDALRDHPEISVFVDAAAVYGESVTILNIIKAASEERMKRFAAASVPKEIAPKLGYVYVSGMWVHGSDKTSYVSDANPLTGDTDTHINKPIAMVGWRPEIERLILSAEVRCLLDTAIVRPATLYGNTSAIWTGPMMAIHNAVKNGADVAKVPLEAGGTPIFIHVADVASGISCVIEKLPLISNTGVYPIFDVMGQVESTQAIFEGVGRALGFKGTVELVGPPDGDALNDALGSSIVGDSTRLKTILGWEGPKRKTFLQGIGVYAKAWQAGFEAHKK
jgi:nucleoside-diphosphate-sugar epimerase